MSRECQVCGENASIVYTVEMGDTWADAVGLPPHSFFGRYLMVHKERTKSGDQMIFCHTEQDLKEEL